MVVIEDEASIASAVAARLRSEGFAVQIAGDGPSGVVLCREVRPDLVILDIMLPGLDGLEVCRQVQKDRPVPVLMLTARDSETDMLVGLASGPSAGVFGVGQARRLQHVTASSPERRTRRLRASRARRHPP